jgi:methylthioribose-1-phosphate isomerase
MGSGGYHAGYFLVRAYHDELSLGEFEGNFLKPPLEWQINKLKLLDQTRLPNEEVYLQLTNYREVAEAIKSMRVRGAPAIGIAAGYGIALGALGIQTASIQQFKSELESVVTTLTATRPTARNLFQVIERMKRMAVGVNDIHLLKEKLVAEAVTIHEEQKEADLKIADLGAGLIKPGSNIITHCNTGPLATAGYGTALGIIIRAYEQGKIREVFATETRPLCQGARLTAWELKQAGVPFKLITDSMSGYVIGQGKIDAVIVGADRIAANGDTANKIGTYTLAVLAKEHNIPFYVAAPTTTIDMNTAAGKDIVIEWRNQDEVTCYSGIRVAPDGVEALNPAFDVTPAKYITAIITEMGILNPLFDKLDIIIPEHH